MKISSFRLLTLIGIWILLSAVLLLTCEVPKEIDFERYMSISQYIFLHKEYLLLHFNGAIYTDKPPLMFWMIALGWRIFGSMTVFWPYMMLCFFSGGSIFLTYQIAKLLYADHNPLENAFKAALFLFTLTFFGMAVCELRVDTLLLFFALLVQYGCVSLSYGKSPACYRKLPPFSKGATLRTKLFSLLTGSTLRSGHVAIFLGIALGLFSKGPIIFLTGIVPALLGLWAFNRAHKSSDNSAAQRIAYKPIIVCTLLGMLPILFWLIPACLKGGTAYTQDVLFGQIANRSVREGESVFFYLVRLPAYLFPFVIFPTVWKNLFKTAMFWKKPRNITERSLHPALYYALTGIVFLFIVFSLFGQKAMHYLLPTMPLWAIFLAGTVKEGKREVKILRIFLVLFAFLGVFMLFWQTGVGLQWLQHLTQYAYNFYLATQSFQPWQWIVFALTAIIGLLVLYRWRTQALIPVLVFISLILQANIQILNQHYFHARFYVYFHEKIENIQQTGGQIQVLLTTQDNQSACNANMIPDIASFSKSSTVSESHPTYLLSNQRCLFFHARHWNAEPTAIFVPRIFCAFGLWEMNEQTKQLMKDCAAAEA